MRILVYGAGVIGSYLCHVLCQNGHTVDLLARGSWAETLRREGLNIEHALQKRHTVDHPNIVEQPKAVHYDAVFAVMQYGQMRAVLKELATLDTSLLILVGNNLDADGMAAAIAAQSPNPKTVLFGFSGTGGRREEGRVVCVRFGDAHLTCGGAHCAPSEETKAVLAQIFTGKYQPSYMVDMDAWLKCHMAFILPVCYVAYAVGCDLRKATRAQRRAMLDATGEADALLRSLGCPMQPEGEEDFYRPGPKRAMMAALLFVMAKTKLGDLAATDHCRHAVAEMQSLDEAFAALRSKAPDFAMPVWDDLKAKMPAWDSLNEQFQ